MAAAATAAPLGWGGGGPPARSHGPQAPPCTATPWAQTHPQASSPAPSPAFLSLTSCVTLGGFLHLSGPQCPSGGPEAPACTVQFLDPGGRGEDDPHLQGPLLSGGTGPPPDPGHTHTSPTVSVCHSLLPRAAPGALSHCQEPPGTPDLQNIHEGEGGLALPQGRPGTSQALQSAQSCQPRASEPWETPPCGLQPPSNLWASQWAAPSSTPGLAPGLQGQGVCGPSGTVAWQASVRSS